jgi:diaminopropionate ammonia-lyase
MVNFKLNRDFFVISNSDVSEAAPYPETVLEGLTDSGLAMARSEITSWPDYQATPLVSLDGLARQLDVNTIRYKDEGWRFGLQSFKPLGGAYAVLRVIQRALQASSGQLFSSSEILAGSKKERVLGVTVCAGTDGNHGRSVAWGSRMFGCRCVIYINEAVSSGRASAIASYGAEVRRVPGSFDDAVRAAKETAREEGWHVVPDTASGGSITSSADVMQGYALLAEEIVEQLSNAEPPTHLFIQAGVGGLAAAVCGQLWQAYGLARPFTVIVEPHSAGCWYESFKAGKEVVVEGELDSLMAGLACGEISPHAWPILRKGAHGAMTIPDEAAAQTMKRLSMGVDGDQPIVGGESGVAGLAGLILASQSSEARSFLKLENNSRIVVVGSEGDTDPETYTKITGRSGKEVRQQAIEGN